MKSQALGRGLGELLGEIDEAYENELPKKDSVVEIHLKSIRPNPYQPRKTFNEASLVELADSIKKSGLLQPIVVKEDMDGYIIIAGERRFRASKIAKLKTIRAIIINSDDEKMREYALIENIQRDELNAIELAFAYNELLKLHNITHNELSSIIHKSRAHITNTLRLLQLSTKTQKALLDGKITAGHAKVLVGVDEKKQQLIVDSIIGQKLTVREVENLVKNFKQTERPQRVESSFDYDYSDIKERFETLGFKTKFTNNRCTIEFNNSAEAEALLALLQK